MKRSVKNLFVLLMVLILTFSNFAMCFAASTTFKATVAVKYQQTESRSMLSMINTLRTGKDAWYWNSDNKTKHTCTGLKKYEYDYNLEKAAMQRAAEIALSFEHDRPDGSKCFTALPSGYSSKAENIAITGGTAAQAFNQWLEADKKYDSQAHRRNMLSGTYKAIGVACVYYNGVYYWVQEFGNANTCPTATTANDGNANVPVTIATSRLKTKTVSVNPTSVSVNMASTGKLPVVTADISFANSYKTSNIITLSCTWKSSDESIVKVQNNSLVPQKLGSTTIKATALDKNLTVNVSVVKGNGYTVTYNANGGKVSPASVWVESGKTTVLPKPTKNVTITYNANGGTSAPAAQNVALSCSGWSTKNSGAAEYKCGDSYKVKADTTLYAVWNGSGSGKVTTAKPTRKGYTFVGWATSKGSVIVAYNAGSAITVTGNTTLYAIWVTTKSNVQGITLPDTASVTYKKSAKLTPTVKTPAGGKYTVKWESSDPSAVKVDSNGNITGAKKYGSASATITCTVSDSAGNKLADTCTVTSNFEWWQWIITILLFGFIWY